MKLLRVEVYYDPSGSCGGRRGCYKARLEHFPELHDAGVRPEEAIRNFMITARSFGLSGDRRDYFFPYDVFRQTDNPMGVKEVGDVLFDLRNGGI